MKTAHPGVLIGVSGQPGLFGEEIVREMARHAERPILFPLSNPTSRMEAAPADLLKWTQGRALIATGSPIAPVAFDGRTVSIAQCNNSYVFPAIGLGVLAGGCRRVSDEMLRAAARELGECSPARNDSDAPLLPPLPEIRTLTRRLARAVAAEAQRQGLAEPMTPEALDAAISREFWEPAYAE